MTEQWQELKETIIELRDNNGTATQQEVCKFLVNLMDVLEKQVQEPKTGHWSRKTKVDAYDIAGVKTWGIKCQCDRCDFTTIVVEDFGYYKYCPNCGVKMVEPQERSEE